jgi:hypothetical protein
MNFFRKIWLACMLVLAVCFLPISAIWGQTLADCVFYDNFNDISRDADKWQDFYFSGGATISETNQRLEITITEPQNPQGAEAGLPCKDNFNLYGDFDLKVDFNLLAWPTPNGVRLGILVGGSEIDCAVKRASHGPADPGGQREVYYAYFSYAGGPEVETEFPTTDTSGKLRMKRTGNKVEMFYGKNGAWQLIDSKTDSHFTGTVGFSVDAASNNALQSVTIAFDNFLAIMIPPSPVAINIMDYQLTKVGAWGKYSYTTPPGFAGFTLTLTKMASGPYAGKYRLGDYHTPDLGIATWRVFDWSADRSLINIYADSLKSYTPPRIIPAVNNIEILIPSPFENNIYWYFKKVPRWDVLAGRFSDGLAWIVFDEDFAPNTVNTDLGLGFVPFGVTGVTRYARGVGEITNQNVDAASGETSFSYQLSAYGRSLEPGVMLLLLD